MQEQNILHPSKYPFLIGSRKPAIVLPVYTGYQDCFCTSQKLDGIDHALSRQGNSQDQHNRQIQRLYPW